MSKKQSKVVSFRLPLKDYAQLLIECSDCESDLSALAKEKFRLSTLVQPLEKKISNTLEQLEKTVLLLDTEKTKTIDFESKIKDLKTQILELEEKLKQEHQKQTELLSSLKASETEKKKIVDLANKQQSVIKVLESKTSSLETEKNDYSSRLNDANEFLESKEIGLSLFGMGEIKQF